MQRNITVQFRPDTMEEGKGFGAVNPKDPRERFAVECLSKSDDGDMYVIEAKVTIVVPKSKAVLFIPAHEGTILQ
jgi:hypothetical protein